MTSRRIWRSAVGVLTAQIRRDTGAGTVPIPGPIPGAGASPRPPSSSWRPVTAPVIGGTERTLPGAHRGARPTRSRVRSGRGRCRARQAASAVAGRATGGAGGKGVRGGGPGVRGGRRAARASAGRRAGASAAAGRAGPGSAAAGRAGPGSAAAGRAGRASSAAGRTGREVARSPIWISRVRIPAIASWNCARMSRCRAASPSGGAPGSFGPARRPAVDVATRHNSRLPAVARPLHPVCAEKCSCATELRRSAGGLQRPSRTLTGLDREGAQDAAHVFRSSRPPPRARRAGAAAPAEEPVQHRVRRGGGGGRASPPSSAYRVTTARSSPPGAGRSRARPRGRTP